jgi:N-acyl-D-aspartate/D-glutamate deacylase
VHSSPRRPARLYGSATAASSARAHADVVVFDPATVGATEVGTRFDLPGGAGRLYADATGIHDVLVAGQQIAIDGEYTGVRPGRVLRSGTDTDTPTLEM